MSQDTPRTQEFPPTTPVPVGRADSASGTVVDEARTGTDEQADGRHGQAPGISNQQAGGADEEERGWWMPSYHPAADQGQQRGSTWGEPSAGYPGSASAHNPTPDNPTPNYPTGSHSTGNYPSGSFPTGSYPTPNYPPPADPPGRSAIPEPNPKRRSRGTLIAAATVAAALIAGVGGGFLGASLTTGSAAVATPSASTQLSSPTVSANLAPAPEGSVEQVAATILPSVVSVLSTSAGSAGEGSGVILSADGLILTNNHVIDGATTLEVQFNDGSTATATVVGADATDDLAVIKAQGVSGLTPAAIGTSADLQVGQDVVAVGSPLGLSATVTSGIVSALNRPVATSDAQQQDPGQQQFPGRGQSQTPAATQSTVINAIQTDAAINPGNSGGPLVDMSGKVVGINSAIASLSSGTSDESGSIGVGFAIPIDQAKRIADEIVATGAATHAVLGASVSDSTLNGNSLLTNGATISALTAGGGAQAAGLQVGDVITKIGEQKVESADALVAAVRSAVPGSSIEITYTRGTESNTVNVTLGSSQ